MPYILESHQAFCTVLLVVERDNKNNVVVKAVKTL